MNPHTLFIDPDLLREELVELFGNLANWPPGFAAAKIRAAIIHFATARSRERLGSCTVFIHERLSR